MRIAVLGMGAMGSRMAAALLRASHSVSVWNRTPATAEALREQGANVAPSPRAAAEGAEIVVAIVRDSDASREVWLSPHDGALAAMSPSAIGIESSTLTTAWVRELGAAFEARSVSFLDGPVVGTRAQADTSSLIYLLGGNQNVVDRAQPVLSAIGSAQHHLGPVGAGTAMKLLVNGLLTIQVAALGELLGAADRMGLDRRRAGEVLAEMPSCSASAKGVTMGMLARNFAPAFPIELVEKDLNYLVQGASGAVPMSAAARDVFARALAAGSGAENMSAVVKLYD